jgi:hypothetical protein
MRSPARSDGDETHVADHVPHSLERVHRSARRVIERHYDEAGCLRSERVDEYVAQRWIASESDSGAHEGSQATGSVASTGGLCGVINAVTAVALLIGLAVIGGFVGACLAGNIGAVVGLLAAPTLCLWWLQHEPPPSSDA